MQQIANELAAEALGYQVVFLGINWNQSYSAGNDLATAMVDLPWLQDTVEENVKGRWKVSYRDAIILDPLNQRLGEPFNLSDNDLALESARDFLKGQIRAAAEFIDRDNDGVGDDWEDRFFGTLTNGNDSDTDEDQADLFWEYAAGSRPNSGGSLPMVTLRSVEDGGEDALLLTFRRRVGSAGGLSYEIEARQDDGSWVGAGSLFSLDQVIPIFDGTGTEIVVFRASGNAAPLRMVRVVVRR